MPSLVSMPPNIITAAFEATSGPLRVAVASARTPCPRRPWRRRATPGRRRPLGRAGPIGRLRRRLASTAATISSYQPSTTPGSASTSSRALVTTATASGPARSRRTSAAPAGARAATRRRASSWIRPAKRTLASGFEEGLGERVAMALVLGTVEREHARADDLRRREARVVDGEPFGVAHHGDGEVATRDQPAAKYGDPRHRLEVA